MPGASEPSTKSVEGLSFIAPPPNLRTMAALSVYRHARGFGRGDGADHFSVTAPDDTWIEGSPALEPHAASNCVPVWAERAVAVEPAPWSAPANEPVTLAPPPALGSANPTSPELLDVPLYPENVSTLGRIVKGVRRY